MSIRRNYPTTTPSHPPTVGTRDEQALSRRGFLQGVGGAGALAAAATVGLGSTLAPAEAEAAEIGPLNPNQRRTTAFRIRKDAANAYLKAKLPTQDCNGDEAAYADLRGNFSKTLPHNSLGEVDAFAYGALLAALDSGDSAAFEAIPLSPAAVRKLANPQGSYAYEMTGGDAHSSRIPPAPAFASATAAAEMGEVYWQALTRDVPFIDYGSDPLIAAAVADLNAFSATVGPKVGGVVTPGTLFRGETPGDLVGPYISQFLWQPFTFGPAELEQRYQVPVAGDDHMTNYAEWLAIQNGAAPAASSTFDPTRRYIADNRALGEYVHRDVASQAYFNAALIMLSYGPAALSPTNPYLGSATQGGFTSFGPPDILDLVVKAANVALKTAWYQKWLVHRRLRPEVFGGRIENQGTGAKGYGIHPDIMGSDAVARVLSANGNRLLPMAFPEGSPTHPAYPAGHATIAGACATILKAFFNESFVVPNPVEASADGLALLPWTGADLTLGAEIDKLANNISLGRDAAGVHYRTDGVDGIAAGEQVAIGILRDYSTVYNEDFDGFLLTRFDGQPIHIAGGDVIEI